MVNPVGPKSQSQPTKAVPPRQTKADTADSSKADNCKSQSSESAASKDKTQTQQVSQDKSVGKDKSVDKDKSVGEASQGTQANGVGSTKSGSEPKGNKDVQSSNTKSAGSNDQPNNYQQMTGANQLAQEYKSQIRQVDAQGSPSAKTVRSADIGSAPASPGTQAAGTNSQPAKGNLLFGTDFENAALGQKQGENRAVNGTQGSLKATIQELGNPGEINNEIVTMTGADGQPTKALHLKVTGKSDEHNQSPLLLEPPGDVPNMYIKERIFIPTEVLQNMKAGDWMTTFPEYKTGGQGANYGGDYRNVHSIVNNGQGLSITDKHDTNANGNVSPQTFASEENKNVPITGGQWMDVEYYNHRGSTDGRSVMKLNGQMVFDRTGNNIGQNNDPINRIMLASPYSNKPADLYVDDVVVTDTPPDGFLN
ncbi:MAG TPA: hypothetical protein V6C52_10180 [Coleofasciculaceae cyanobacterium]|jgi:hypothetical protein